MSGKEFIIDYEENKGEIEYWFSIKCEQKYRRFAELLEFKGEITTWNNVRDLYRYDKRLIFNCFRYISFLEEYLRAIIVRNSQDREKEYEMWQEKYISDLAEPIIKLNEQGLSEYHNCDLKDNLKLVQSLRNIISHNKIVLESDYKKEIAALHDLLPSNYIHKFEETIAQSSDGLSISDGWKVIKNFHNLTIISSL